MKLGALLTWGAIAASVGLVVDANMRKPHAQRDEPVANAAQPAMEVPMADRPAGATGLHPTDQGGDPDRAAAVQSTADAQLARFVRDDLHGYRSLQAGVFSYDREPSDDDRSRGVRALPPLKVRYHGKTAAGAYVFTTATGAYRFLWCHAPCTVMESNIPTIEGGINTTMDAMAPSVLHLLYLDASAGRLDRGITYLDTRGYQPTSPASVAMPSAESP